MAQEPGYNANAIPPATAHDLTDRPRCDGRLRAGLGVQGRDDRRRALATRHHAEHGVPGPGLPAGRRPRDPRRGAARAGDAEGQADPPALLEHRHGPDRRALPRRKRPEEVDGALRVRAPTGIDYPGESRGLLPSYWSGSTIGTVPIGQGVSVTAHPARLGLRRDRERRRVDPAAPRRPRRRPASGETEETAHPRARRRLPAAHDVARRRLGSGDGRARRHSRLRRRRQDGDGAEAGAERLHPRRVRRDLRRDGAGLAPAPARARDHRRAARGIYGGIVAAPAFEQIASFDLQYLEVPPDLRIK